MSGIAEVLVNLGYQVSGSDRRAMRPPGASRRLGARIAIGQAARTSRRGRGGRVHRGAPRQPGSRGSARHRRIPVVPRALMLAELMRLKQGMAIAGTHGKTTTTVAGGERAGRGRARSDVRDRWPAQRRRRECPTGYRRVHRRRSRRIGRDVPESAAGDRSGHQHRRRPHGHLRHDFARLKQAFIEFLHQMPFYGIAVLCATTRTCARSCRSSRSRSSATVWRGREVRAVDVKRAAARCISRRGVQDATADLDIVLNLPGGHNVQNALAAIGVATELEVADADIQRALADFNGVGRRFQRYGEVPVVSEDKPARHVHAGRRLRPSPG